MRNTACLSRCGCLLFFEIYKVEAGAIVLALVPKISHLHEFHYHARLIYSKISFKKTIIQISEFLRISREGIYDKSTTRRPSQPLKKGDLGFHTYFTETSELWRGHGATLTLPSVGLIKRCEQGRGIYDKPLNPAGPHNPSKER